MGFYRIDSDDISCSFEVFLYNSLNSWTMIEIQIADKKTEVKVELQETIHVNNW